jgi:hypothetical protein
MRFDWLKFAFVLGLLLAANHLQLVAVEYAVPTNLAAAPPEGFDGKLDEWDRNDTFGLWTLHAWIWLPNPDGVFADTNSLLPE